MDHVSHIMADKLSPFTEASFPAVINNTKLLLLLHIV
jgi:hypothetical protein